MNNKILNIILLILWLGTIFFFSSQNSEDTTNTSSKLDFIINIIVKDESKKDEARFIVRKIAHFTEYFILALLVLNVVKDYKTIDYKWLLFILIMCIIYAISDEYHQSFVDGRVSSIKDVIIDSCGSLLSLICYKVIRILKK